MVSFKAISIGSIITVLILLVVLFEVVATVIPDVQTAGESINGTGAPLASFFGDNGVIILGIMAAILLGVFVSIGLIKKGSLR